MTVSSRKVALVAFSISAAIAVGAIAQQKVKVTLAGKALSLDSVQVKGKTYVSLDQLKAQLGASAGGANQISATEGVLNEWLFNGVWRFRVTEIVWDAENDHWIATMEMRNGTKITRHPAGNGLEELPEKSIFLVTEGGSTLTMTTTSNNETQDTIGYKDMPPGAGATAKIHYRGSATDKPVKLLCELKPKSGLPYVKDPSFRVDLTKSKS